MMSMDITEFAHLGGKARADSMTKAQRSEAARKAVIARWDKQRAAAKKPKKKRAA